MSHEEMFLRTIRENPTDDATRLAYADWLEERDHPLGKFIHLQYALEQLEGEECQAVQQQVRELLVEHGNTWSEGLAGRAQQWEFRGGFVEDIEITANAFLAHGGELLRRFPIRHVRLGGSRSSLREFLQCPHLKRVRSLDLRKPRWLAPQDIEELLDSGLLEQLETLFLRLVVNPTSLALLQEGRLDQLAELHLTLHLDLSAARTLMEVNPPANLGSLEVVGTNLGAGVGVLASTPFLHTVGRLDLQSNGIYLSGLETVLSADWPMLQDLDLSDNNLDHAGLEALAQAPLLSQLNWLRLGNSALGVQGLEVLLRSPHLGGLVGLELNWNRLHQAAVKRLCETPLLANLKHLNLASNVMGREGARAFVEAPYPERLESVNLDNNGLGSGGARLLAGCSRLANLTQLSLYLNQIGTEGVRALARSPILRNLTTLNLAVNVFDDEGARCIASSPYLEGLISLNLSSQYLTSEGVRKLCDAFEPRVLQRLSGLSRRGLEEDLIEKLRQRFGVN